VITLQLVYNIPMEDMNLSLPIIRIHARSLNILDIQGSTL
jgi:hypothetical protein